MFIFGIIVFIIFLCLIIIRYRQFPYLDKIEEMIEVMKDTNISHLDTSLWFLGGVKISLHSQKSSRIDDLPKPIIVPQNLIVEVNLQMVGYIHWPKSEDGQLINLIGREVKKDQIIGRIEALKLFVDLESPSDGKLVELMVEDSSPIEFGQALARIEVF